MLETSFVGMTSLQTPSTREHANVCFTESSTTMLNSNTTHSRRHSSPGVTTQLKIEAPDLYQPTRKRSSLPSIPPAPVIQPQRLPSVVDARKSSWRLSFSAENRGDQLRKLSQGVGVPALLKPDKLVNGPRSSRTWLYGQGLRMTSQVVDSSDDILNTETSLANPETCLSSKVFGGVDGGGDLTAVLHLHEMGISQRLASRGLRSSCSSPQLSSIGSRTHQRGVSSTSGVFRVNHKSCAQRIEKTTDSLPLSKFIPEFWGNVLDGTNIIQDGTSSFRPCANNSVQPSRKSSPFSILSILPAIKNKTDQTKSGENTALFYQNLHNGGPRSSALMSPEDPQTPLHHDSIPIASASCDSLPLRLTGYHRQPTIDINSAAISETESFRQRELELSIVRTRFAAAEATRPPSTPRSSKFREEFDARPPSNEEPVLSKLSAFSRLSRFAARSFDGPSDTKVGISMTPMAPTYELNELQNQHLSKSAKGVSSPAVRLLEGSSVLGIWSNAVLWRANHNANNVASKLHIPGNKRHQDRGQIGFLNSRSKSHVSKESKEKKQMSATKGLGWRMGDNDFENDSEGEGNPENDWEAELAEVAQKAKWRSRNIVKKPTGPDRRYPASWSKFSSHDRPERTSSADAKDRIDIKDFATDGSEFLDHGKKTLREKLQKRIAAEIDKQATTEVQTSTHRDFGRRSSLRPSGDLEFPELEVLPLYDTTLMNKEDIAEHVEEVLMEEELDRKIEELDAIFEPVRRAGSRSKVAPGGGTKETSDESVSNRSCKMKATAKADSTAAIALKTEVGAASETLVRRYSGTARGPIARHPEEEPSKSKAAPNLAPAVPLPTRGRGAGKSHGLIDGSVDYSSENSVFAQVHHYEDEFEDENEEISIADPKFYDDCIINTTTPGSAIVLCRGESELLDDAAGKGSQKSKYRTWSGKHWDSVRHSAKARRNLGLLKLRKSTDEALNELKKAEVSEREKALRAAEEAWGGR